MKKMVMLLGVLLLSTSCVDLNGSLQVNEAFKVKIKSGFLNLKTKTITIAPGSHQAQLTVKSSKNITLELKGGSLGEIKIPIKSSDSLRIPVDGAFTIEGSKIEQPFNASGVINTEVDHHSYTDVVERCERSVVETRCEKVCTKEGRCDSVCKDITVTFHGLKDVSFHYMRTDRQVSLDLMADNSSAVVARLTARGIENDKIIDRESICR